MKKLFNKKAFALLLCLALALTALFTVTAFADTEPAADAPAQTEQTADSGATSGKALASGIAIGIAGKCAADGRAVDCDTAGSGVSAVGRSVGRCASGKCSRCV